MSSSEFAGKGKKQGHIAMVTSQATASNRVQLGHARHEEDEIILQDPECPLPNKQESI